MLNNLAADVELATPERERWIVQTESFYAARGRVYLELADASRPRSSGGWRCSRRSWGEAPLNKRDRPLGARHDAEPARSTSIGVWS